MSEPAPARGAPPAFIMQRLRRMAVTIVPRAVARRCTTRRVLAIALALGMTSREASAQASPLLPLDDVAYAWIDALMARGHLHGLSALERPYTVAAVRAALDSVRAQSPSVAVASLLERVERAAAKFDAGRAAPDAPFAARASAGLFATVQSSYTRELALGDDSSGVHPGGVLRLALRAGPMVAASRLAIDDRLQHDPLFTGRRDRAISGRAEDAYVAGQWRYGGIFFGRVARTLGPAPLTGLQLGATPYTYDHLHGRLGSHRLHLSTVVARLDREIVSPDSVAERWMAVHRLAGRVGAVELAMSEMMVWGGVARGLEFAYLNPLNFYDLSQYNETGDGNVSFAFDAAWRTRRGTLGAQLLLDDFQIDECDTACDEPPSYGVTVTLEGAPLFGEQRWFASYTRVSNLAYRAPTSWERTAYRGVSLGRERSDYEEARLGLDLLLPAGITLRPYVSRRRQGEGDYRLPFPPPEEYAATPAFLAGTPIRVWRAGTSGAASLGWLELQGDVGVNRARDWGHEAGRSHSAFEGRVRISFEPDRALEFVSRD